MKLRIRTASDMLVRRQPTNSTMRIFMHAVGLHGPHAAIVEPQQHEQPKVILDPRLRAVFLRSLIHLLPVCTTIAIAWLNIHGGFIGYNFDNRVTVWTEDLVQITGNGRYDRLKLTALLLAAKMYELLVVASLTAIIFHQIRQELVLGDGVLFGILPSAMAFNQLSYLWTREYWAAVSARGKSWRLSFLVAFIGLCTVLVSLVGTISATLIVPRFDRFPAGGTKFWVFGDEQALFPTVLNAHPSCLTADLDLGANPMCPSYDYRTVWGVIGEYHRYLGTAETELGLGFDVTDDLDVVTRRFSVPISRVASANGTQVSGPHFALASVARTVAEEYFDGLVINTTANVKYPYRYGRDLLWTITAKAPTVQAKCVRQMISNTSQPADFQRTEPSTSQDGAITQEQIFSAAAAEGYALDQPFALWLPLSGSSMGAFVHHGASINATPHILDGHACTFDAWWATSQYSVSRHESVHITCPDSSPLCSPTAASRVALTPSWMRALSPAVTSHSRRTTVIAELLRIITTPEHGTCTSSDTGEADKCRLFTEVGFAALIASGMSRSGANGLWVNVPVDDYAQQLARDGAAYRLMNSSDQPKLADLDSSLVGLTHPPATAFAAKVSVEGFGYSVSSVGAKLAVGLLLAYCGIAVGHVAYQLVVCRWSSEAWDSMPEMIALAASGSGRRDEALADTGGGITQLATLRRRVTVGARNGAVELRFVDERDGGAAADAAEAGKEAGVNVSTSDQGSVFERVEKGEWYS